MIYLYGYLGVGVALFAQIYLGLLWKARRGERTQAGPIDGIRVVHTNLWDRALDEIVVPVLGFGWGVSCWLWFAYWKVKKRIWSGWPWRRSRYARRSSTPSARRRTGPSATRTRPGGHSSMAVRNATNCGRSRRTGGRSVCFFFRSKASEATVFCFMAVAQLMTQGHLE